MKGQHLMKGTNTGEAGLALGSHLLDFFPVCLFLSVFLSRASLVNIIFLDIPPNPSAWSQTFGAMVVIPSYSYRSLVGSI